MSDDHFVIPLYCPRLQNELWSKVLELDETYHVNCLKYGLEIKRRTSFTRVVGKFTPTSRCHSQSRYVACSFLSRERHQLGAGVPDREQASWHR